ncbi:MAG TPA: hypothetical protein VMF52_05430 [Steroidobacteraceae bacterium]|nr:hypothetical protein [Steroidobacteraceae bacterium]
MFNWLVRARDGYFSLPRLQFEAITFGLAFLVGLLVMPIPIYLAGLVALKAYHNGGLFSLYGDWFAGLFGAHSSFWIVALGPFVFLTLFRACRWLLGKTRDK